MLLDFLEKNQSDILVRTEKKTLELAGVRPSSYQLKRGLPIFFQQLLGVLRLQKKGIDSDPDKMANAAAASNEPALAAASGHPGEAEVARQAGLHGLELLRLGYTLSHVVHAYGAMCQAITEVAVAKDMHFASGEFRDLNRCLDVAIAGAVTEFQSLRNTQNMNREIENLGFLAHELRNALATVNISLQLIKTGTVGFGGSTGRVLDSGLIRMEDLIARSLTEVRLRVDPKMHIEPVHLIRLVDQIIVTAEVEARARNQVLEIQVDPTLVFDADQQLVYSALFNLIQNALKYSPPNSKIQVRGALFGENVVIEVEDECGGLTPEIESRLFKSFVQQHENRKGMGLGLSIAQKSISLLNGTVTVSSLPTKGCIFKITLPKKPA